MACTRAVRSADGRHERRSCFDAGGPRKIPPVRIILNGEPRDLDRAVTVTELLTQLEIDPRRVAVEHNLAILKRRAFGDVVLGDGDTVEIVNFVGGG